MRNFPSHPFYFWSCHTLVIQNLTRIFRLLNRIQILHLLLDHQDYPMAPTHPKRLFIKGLWCYNHNYLHYMYLPPLITLYYQINQKPTTTTKKHRNLPPLPNTTNLPMHTHLDLDYIKTPEKLSLTQTHTHTHELKHTHTYLWTFFSAPSSVRKKKSTMKNSPKLLEQKNYRWFRIPLKHFHLQDMHSHPLQQIPNYSIWNPSR